MPDPTAPLIPNMPLFPPEQSVTDCAWLACLTDDEMQHWPRRNVSSVALCYPAIVCPCCVAGVYTVMLVLN